MVPNVKALLVFGVFITASYAATNGSNGDKLRCAAMKKYFDQTADEHLQRAHFEVLENCLFYNLSQQADKNMKLNLTKTLQKFAPSKNGERVKISVSNPFVYNIMEMYGDEVRVKGSLNMSWNDDRLRWNPKEWSLDKMKINEVFNIWTPKEYGKYDHLYGLYNYVTFKNVWVTYKGHVTAILQFEITSACENDYSYYPMHISRCCGPLDSQLTNNLLTYDLDKSTPPKLSKKLRDQFTVENLAMRMESDDDNDRKDLTLQMCLKMTRGGSVQRTKLMLPLVISVLLVIVAPLFGSMQSQLYAKMFALLLQFLCFQFLAEHSPGSETSDVTPKIYSFYEFTIAMTITSLLVTLVFKALSNGKSKLPPSHKLKLIASLVNKIWFWSSSDTNESPSGTSGGPTSNGHLDESTKTTMYTEEWKDLFIALHSVVSLILILFYVIVSVIINF